MMTFLRHAFLPAAFALCFAAAGGGSVYAQKATAEKPAADAKPAATSAAPSAAYAELLLKRTELRSELEALVLDYTEDYPRIKELRFVLGLIDRDVARLAKVKPTESAKLTVALGKLMLRHVELEADLWKLRQSYQDDHPDVKQARRKVEIFESAINEMLN